MFYFLPKVHKETLLTCIQPVPVHDDGEFCQQVFEAEDIDLDSPLNSTALSLVRWMQVPVLMVTATSHHLVGSFIISMMCLHHTAQARSLSSPAWVSANTGCNV